jgi:type VI secretion system protein VasG
LTVTPEIETKGKGGYGCRERGRKNDRDQPLRPVRASQPDGPEEHRTATGFCKMRGNPYVELVHWIHILLQDPRTTGAIRTRPSPWTTPGWPATSWPHSTPAARRDIDLRFLAADRGGHREGLALCFAACSRPGVRTGHLVFGMLKTRILRNALVRHLAASSARSIGRRSGRRVRDGSSIRLEPNVGGAPHWAPATRAPPMPRAVRRRSGETLAKFSVDLTQQAPTGEIDRSSGATPRSAR